MYNCKTCEKVFENKQAFCSHSRHCRAKSLGEDSTSHLLASRGWSKGLTKDTDPRLLNLATGQSERMKAWHSTLSKATKEATNKKISDTLTARGDAGGYRRGAGRSWKKGWYNGTWCDSSWELAWVVYQSEHGVTFARNTDAFIYFVDGKKLRYYPDFKVEGGYVEVKGWKDSKFEHKMAQFPETSKLVVLCREEMKEILIYVVDKYGKDFCKMYQPCECDETGETCNPEKVVG